MDVAERARRHQPHARPRGALAILFSEPAPNLQIRPLRS
jgi:hypothetical protein